MFDLYPILDERVDETIIEERAILLERLVLMGLTLVFLTLNFDLAVACGWLALMCVGEASAQYVTRGIKRHTIEARPGSPGERLAYILLVTFLTCVWTVLPVIYWMTGTLGFQIVAIVVATGQLIHAQVFTFRSPMILLINGGIPAVALATLILGFGGFEGRELLTLSITLAGCLSYVFRGATAHILSTNALKRSQADMRALAYSDMLTGLQNRRMFTERLRHLLTSAEADGRRLALMLIDLDKFKVINDSLGHDAGDAVLKEAAARFLRTIEEKGEVFRLGGDEFAVLLFGPCPGESIDAVGSRLCQAFESPITFEGRTLTITPSIGAARFPHEGICEDTLYKAADLYLYEAKRRGGNTCVAKQTIPPSRRESGAKDISGNRAALRMTA